MYRVIVIDDEPITVEGLIQTIPWKKWNCQVVGQAYNGIEGLELVRKIKPDMVISDISMPEMDGLSMIAVFKSEFPDMEVTILTGFRDFEYARKAINLGCTRFLLKPTDTGEIEEAIETMKNNLDKRTAQDRKTEERAAEKTENVASSFIVNKAVAYMEENYARKITLTKLAEVVYVNPSHLSRLLNRYTEQSFSELLNNVRIRKAQELLEDPALRIGEIAENVGFLDISHFSKVFKKVTGVSAQEYRNRIVVPTKGKE